MVAVDILEVPVSQNSNRYLLVIQDYKTKWAEAIPIPNQTAARITTELIRVFSCYSILDILHSDQGKNYHLAGNIKCLWYNQIPYHSLSPFW